MNKFCSQLRKKNKRVSENVLGRGFSAHSCTAHRTHHCIAHPVFHNIVDLIKKNLNRFILIEGISLLFIN